MDTKKKILEISFSMIVEKFNNFNQNFNSLSFSQILF